MSKKLKPCPFCGNKSQYLLAIPFDSRYGNKAKYVCCIECHAQGALAKTEKEAIAAWNKRVRGD
jgi:Lar family restriction alleviation protein